MHLRCFHCPLVQFWGREKKNYWCWLGVFGLRCIKEIVFFSLNQILPASHVDKFKLLYQLSNSCISSNADTRAQNKQRAHLCPAACSLWTQPAWVELSAVPSCPECRVVILGACHCLYTDTWKTLQFREVLSAPWEHNLLQNTYMFI